MRRPIGAKPGGTGGVGNGASVSWKAIVTLEKMLAMWWRAASWLSLMGEGGYASDGFKSAGITSLAAVAMTASADEAVRILVGNHSTMSAMRSTIDTR
jgi:hypothetical protein